MVPPEPTAVERCQLNLYGQQEVLRGGRLVQVAEPPGAQRRQDGVQQLQPGARGRGPAPPREFEHELHQCQRYFCPEENKE